MSIITPRDPEDRAPSPPESWEPLLRLVRLALRPLERFLRIEAASSIVLLATAAVALLWVSSPWAESYAALWHTPLGVVAGPFRFERPLEWFVNDGLMVIFFFVVGMEIRRELAFGELSEWRRASLPVVAALGGMLAPAALYLAIGGDPATRSGWGVPMATDIAFAVGILALLGRRVPPALRVLLLALAVIDDLGAIVVIAIFYSSGISLTGVLVAGGALAAIVAMQRLGVRAKLAYVPPALVAWAGIYAAGVHPTIAGVIVGMMTPVRARLGSEALLEGVRAELEQLANETGSSELSSHELEARLRVLSTARREALSPAESLIHTLHPWVAFGVMPVFALANAGVSLSVASLDATSWRALVGVAVGLALGKPLGVLLACGLALRLRVAALPAGLTLRHLVVLGVVAGVGFTMAIFIAQLAFADPALLTAAKLGVMAASVAAALLALALGRALLRPVVAPGAARTADEAESSTAA